MDKFYCTNCLKSYYGNPDGTTDEGEYPWLTEPCRGIWKHSFVKWTDEMEAKLMKEKEVIIKREAIYPVGRYE